MKKRKIVNLIELNKMILDGKLDELTKEQSLEDLFFLLYNQKEGR